MTTLDDVADGSGVAASGMSYDKLDFTRPERELRPHYTSSSTLRSVKSNSPNSRCLMFGEKHVLITTAIAATAIAETTAIADKPP